MAEVYVSAGSSGPRELPKIGPQQAVCAFVEPIGKHKKVFNGKEEIKDKLIIIWELTERLQNGEYAGRRMMISKKYTMSLNDKANLRKDLEGWRSVPFTPEELKRFNVASVVGANCIINVTRYDRTDGNEGRNVGAIMPLMPGQQKLVVESTELPQWVAKIKAEAIDAQPEQPTNGTSANNDTLPF